MRYYNSAFANSSQFDGLFGHGWSSNLELRIIGRTRTPEGFAIQSHSVVIQEESGYRFRLTSVDGGPWTTKNGTRVSFSYDENVDLYTWIDGPLMKVFYATGDLQSITHRNGEFLIFDYSPAGTKLRLDEIQH